MRCRSLKPTRRGPPGSLIRRVLGRFLTAGTRSGNSVRYHPKGLYRIVFAAGSGRHGCNKSATQNDRHGTAAPARNQWPGRGYLGLRSTRETRMSNPNQNPGQQNQTPGQKPGQQQQGGGQQKPGQQQQQPNPNPQR